MSRDHNTISLVEAVILTALTAILSIAGFYLPLMGYLLFIIAVPYIIMSVRHPRKYVFTSVIAAAILISFLTFPTYGIYTALLGGLVGSVMGHFMKLKKDSSTVIFYGTLAATFSLVVMLSLATLVSGVSLVDMLNQIIDEAVMLTDTMGLSGMVENSELSIMELMETFKMVLPSKLILSGALFAVFNYFIGSIVLKRLGSWAMPARPFSEFMLPSNILIGTTLILIMTYLAGKMNIVDTEVLFLNVLNIFIYVFLVQGIAVLFFMMDRRGFGKGFKIVIAAVIFIAQLMVLAAAIGWLDSALDFRRLRKGDQVL